MYDKFYDKSEKLLNEWCTDYASKTSESEKKYAPIAVKRILSTFRTYFDVIDTCKITVGKTRVNKIKGNFKNSWYFEQDRLFILPTVSVTYDQLGSINISNLNEFNRFDINGKPVIPDNRFPRKKSDPPTGLAHNLWYIRSRDEKFYDKLVKIIHEACGSRLDDLNQQLLAINADIESKLSEIVPSGIASKKSKEAIKFQTQFVKFLKNHPALAEADADFILKCLNVNPSDLDALQKFMWVRKGCMVYVDEDTIKQAQDLAKIAEVHEA